MNARDAKRDAESSIAIDVAPPSPLVVRLRCRAGLASMLRDVALSGGKTYFAQVREIYALKFGPGKLSPIEYYHYGLYEDELEIDFDEDTMLVKEPELVGLPCRAAVSIRTYEGREQNQVDAILGTEEASGKKEPGGKKKAAPATKKSSSKKFR